MLMGASQGVAVLTVAGNVLFRNLVDAVSISYVGTNSVIKIGTIANVIVCLPPVSRKLLASYPSGCWLYSVSTLSQTFQRRQ